MRFVRRTLPRWLRDFRISQSLLMTIGLALVAIAYWPTLSADFIWDDDHYVVANACLRSAPGLWSIWREPSATPQYYPLVHTSFWLEYQTWGLHPRGYHATNLLLHLANALLLAALLKRVAVPAAGFIALVFALHPVGVESVAWIAERKNVLSTLFYLLAMLVYFRFRSPLADASRPASRWRWYLVTLMCFACALLSKTVTCSMPAAILVITWWKHGRVTRDDLLPTLPFFALGGMLAFVTVYLEKHHVGAEGAAWNLSAIDRVLIAGHAVWFYLAKLAWPADLTFVYPRWQIDARDAVQYMFPVVAVGSVIALWFARYRWGRGPLAAMLLFIGTLTPALGFFDIFPMQYTFVADHYQYLACIAPIALIVAAMATWSTRLRLPPYVIRGTGSAMLLVLAVLTWRQTHVYHDAQTLWEDTLAKNPDCFMACNNLANLLVQQGESLQAMPLYRRAIQLNPSDPITRTSYGGVLLAEGEYAAAAEQLAEAVKLDPTDAGAHSNLGMAYSALGRGSDAVGSFEKAVSIDPESADLHFNYGIMLFHHDRYHDSEREFREVVARDPDRMEAHYNLANSCYMQRSFEAAEDEYHAALKLEPNSAMVHQDLGLLLLERRDGAGAATHFRICIEQQPDNATAHVLLARSLALQGRKIDARAQAVQALNLDPHLDVAKKLLHDLR